MIELLSASIIITCASVYVLRNRVIRLEQMAAVQKEMNDKLIDMLIRNVEDIETFLMR